MKKVDISHNYCLCNIQRTNKITNEKMRKKTDQESRITVVGCDGLVLS